MAITVKHSKVSAIPDGDDTSLVLPSDWNADHTLVGTVPVANGGTGASTLTGYVVGNGTSAMTAVTTIPSGDVSGLGTMATQNANAIAVTGGTINGTTIGATTASNGAFTYFSTSSTTSTTPVLSYNASNCNFAVGATIPNSYLQAVMQNKSGTATASTNWAVSNDLGTDSSYYGEFGMNSSAFSAGTPSDYFSLNNGIYFSGHDGDITIGSGNGFKTYFAWGTAGQSAHVINANGAIGLNTNITGTTNFGTSGQVLTSAGNAATPTWTTPATGTVTSVTGTAPVVSSGGNTPAISMPAATTSINGYLSATDWTTFNNKGSGTVTSVSALTLGTTGADVSSTVATGTTTPVITLNIPTASATNRGALSAADWTTFNGKQDALVSGTNIKTVNSNSLLGSGNVSVGTVTSVGFTGGIVSVATATSTPAFTIAGTSGGIPYFSSGTTWATSAALTANALVIGGGAGAAPATTTTGTGVVTALGVNTGTAGAFVVNGGVLGTPSSGTVTNLTGTASININGTVGATTAASGSFTSLTATSVGSTGILAKTGGKTAVTGVAATTTLTTGGTTLASQAMATGATWRVTAYGTVVAANSATVRTVTMACFWGTTQLTAITTGAVLASTAQTTPWKVEFEITGSSATAAWVTGFLSAQVTSATIPLNYVATAASTTSLTTTSTLDFRVANGTAAVDAINVQQVVIERIV